MNVAGRYYTQSGNSNKLADEQFKCNGEFLFMHKGRPNDEDLARVSVFAKGIVG